MAKGRLGIIGGMGSVAAAYFFQRVVELTPAKTDQEYIETLVHNNTAVPDRTQGILGLGPSPLPELLRSVAILNAAGADFIVLACMTSHYFVDELRAQSSAVIIDAMEETARYVARHHPEVRRVGLLASTGAIKSEAFHRRFRGYELETLALNDAEQQFYFMDSVYQSWGIKTGHVTGEPRNRFLRAAELLRERGAQVIVGGCSEVPLVLSQDDMEEPFIDSIDILIKTAINRCLGLDAVSAMRDTLRRCGSDESSQAFDR